jgi:hypothetical protein
LTFTFPGLAFGDRFDALGGLAHIVLTGALRRPKTAMEDPTALQL